MNTNPSRNKFQATPLGAINSIAYSAILLWTLGSREMFQILQSPKYDWSVYMSIVACNEYKL